VPLADAVLSAMELLIMEIEGQPAYFDLPPIDKAMTSVAMPILRELDGALSQDQREATSIGFHDALARGRVTAGGINFAVPGGMLETAEDLCREYRIGRVGQDEFAVASHRKAVAAQENGTFDDEIVPVTVKSRKGEQVMGALLPQ
jgi:acetyl-CoA acetyltransferase